MRCSLVPRLAALAVLASLSSAGSEREVSVRGYLLEGQLLLYPPAQQQLVHGCSLVSEATGESNLFELGGLSELTREGADVRSLFSQPLPMRGGQIVLRGREGDDIGFGDLVLAVSGDSWQILSNSNELSGRPVFDIVASSRSFVDRGEEQFALTGELALSADVLTELGMPVDQTHPVGSLVLLGSPLFDAARPQTRAATPGPAVIGPDVIVSTVGSTLTKNGTVGSITAYSMTTVSCNIGDQNAIWIDCTSGSQCNQHPVIGQQMYRLKTVAGATRFEQIGMSWLKHGFCALDAPSCPGGTYTPNGSCDWLGLFATDTYDASLNGSQGNLGPRSEVNSWTGLFPYPYVNNGCGSSTSICKRLQIANNDLDPAQNAGAQYLGEVVYITTDELPGTRYNNYSCRAVNVGSFSGGGYNLSFTGGTLGQLSAVQRWAQLDAGVAIDTIDIPGDGRFLLATKVTSLGGGQFHYEYALLNMNSDRGGQAFSVPLPTGASATNVGFHDVDYHSGEPYALTDWTATITPGANVSWATQTFAQNANANALRWSTTYNFRFDSDRPPVQGNVTLTLFKAGTPTSVIVPGVDIPSGSCPDSDGDGVDDCLDGCPNDPGKTAPGVCGCGVADTDSDGDGTPNCNDGCPNDPNKTSPGTCGCGVADTDSDGDGTLDCNDGCPNDPNKTAPGGCGCGVADVDSDGDGDLDCNDNCPNFFNPAQADGDGDGVGNVCDNCPSTSNPSQSDGDADAVGDVCDNCPSVFNPPQGDDDGDGFGNSCDGCPNDPGKIAPGVCGCGVADTDSDGDGTPNCNDGCPNDPSKIAPGICGCGVAEVDSDGDGALDCVESCPNDPNKTSPGQCGCGVPDTDSDGDGVADCIDNCDALANPGQSDCDLDGEGDACEIANGTQWDSDQNGVPDQCEQCPAIHSYCTAGTTTNGCNATLSATGTPSVAASSGFLLTCANVEGQKTGLLFYGVSGPKAGVWSPGSSSFLCVKAPVQRTPSQNSGGNANACDGTLAIDFLDYLATHPSALGAPMAAGAICNGQTWFRDPPAPGTTNLSDGLQWTMCP